LLLRIVSAWENSSPLSEKLNDTVEVGTVGWGAAGNEIRVLAVDPRLDSVRLFSHDMTYAVSNDF